MTTDTPVTPADAPPAQQSRLKRWGGYLRNAIILSTDTMKVLTDRLMGALRLFAAVGLALIAGLVVYQAISSAKSVLVKPFTVAKSIVDLNPDSGRVIASQLSRELQEAETAIDNTLKGQGTRQAGQNMDDRGEPVQIISTSASTQLGSNIKLPETGIAISDVVDFISSIFGRRNIVGSVYQDQGKLFMQVELGENVFTYSRDLGSRPPNALNFDLIKEMLSESRIDLLSAAAPKHNLYYYCAGKTNFVGAGAQEGALGQWFGYCANLRSSQLTPESLGELLKTLQQEEHKQAVDGDDMLKHVLDNTLANAVEKTKLLCPDYEQTKVCVAAVAANAAPVVAPVLPSPPLAPIAAHPRLPDAFDFQPETSVAALVTGGGVPIPEQPEDVQKYLQQVLQASPPLADLATLQALWDKCQAPDTLPAASLDMLASNQTESDATLLFNNKLYPQAVAKYIEALQKNCKNAFAWANMGVLLTQQKNADTAVLALEAATSVNNRIDWMQNSLCIARAYRDPMALMEKRLEDKACADARMINPANRVVLDKQFYLSIADRYFDEGGYPQASSAYQTALSIDRKLDCNTNKAVKQLYLLETQYQVQGAWKAACEIKNAAIPLPDNRHSACEEELSKFPCPTAN
jgi:tetratricopeptide (TPR) repeat protein